MTGNEIIKENKEAHLWKFTSSIQDVLTDLKALREENKTLREYIKKLICPITGCDNKGTIAVQISHGEWEKEPCERCYEREQLLKGGEDE